MDIKSYGTKLMAFLKKYKYPIVILMVGLVLLMIPGKQQDTSEETVQLKQTVTQPDMTQQLEQILSQIQGVGKVQVLLSVAEGESYLYQYDEDVTVSDASTSDRKDTVIITDGDRNQSPVLSQVLPPKYLGAIIVCQGAGKPEVKLAVVEAVSRLTGLGADAISVMKMK